MVFKKLFGGSKERRSKEEEPEVDPLADLVLSKLKVGYLLDYDMETWRVVGYNRYDFDGDRVEEWEIEAGRDKRYLELEHEEDGWSFTRKIPIGAIDGDVRREIQEHEDPPSKVTFEGTEYYLEESLAGHMYEGGEGDGVPLIRWEYLDADETGFLSIEQWGENQFAAAVGAAVEDYQFSNILPGSA